MPIEQESYHRLPQVTTGHFALQVRLESRAQDHQLIDQMTDLQALVVILCRAPADPSILVLQRIAVIFLGIEPFVFDLPAQPPGVADEGGRLRV